MGVCKEKRKRKKKNLREWQILDCSTNYFAFLFNLSPADFCQATLCLKKMLKKCFFLTRQKLKKE